MDSYDKPDVPTGGSGAEDGEKPEYYSKPWDTSLYSDQQIVIRLSQPSVFIGEIVQYDKSKYLTKTEINVDYTLECVCAMHNGVMEYYNIYTLEEKPKSVKFTGGCLIKELIHMCDTSKITDMSRMFESCTNLRTLDLSGWDTSRVRSMYNMFAYCENLLTINVDNWNTSKVEDFTQMFGSCKKLRELNINHFDVSSLRNMYNTFLYCESLISLDLSNWRPRGLTSLMQCFVGCLALSELNMSNWDTPSLTNMFAAFSDCKSLTSLDLSSFTVSGELDEMFRGCNVLETLILGNFNVARDLYSIFNNTFALELTNIDMSRCNDTSKTYLTNAFNNRIFY